MGDVVMTVRFEEIRTTRRGRHDPNFGKRLIFLRGQYAGMEGWYVERLDHQHRVVVAHPDGTDRVRAMWSHTFEMETDGEYVTFEEAERRRAAAATRGRRRGRAGGPRPVSPSSRDLVGELSGLMERLGVDTISEEVLAQANQRRQEEVARGGPRPL